MDISSLIDRPTDGGGPAPPSSSSAASSPVTQTRRNTVHSLLNDDDEYQSPTQSRRTSHSNIPSSPKQQPATASTKVKPRRYSTPPIWAQEWRGKQSAKTGGSGGGGASIDSATNSNGATPKPSGQTTTKGIAPRVESASGLPVSFTGVLPYEELTRKITEWLYSNMFQLKEDRQYMEVEIKLGSLCAKANEQRLKLPVLTETVIENEYARQNTFFKAKMDDEMFNRAMTYLDRLSGSGEDKPLAKTMSKTRDVIFSAKQNPNKLRVTYDEFNRPITKIVKRRVSDLMIYSIGDLCDLRISINVELPPEKVEGVSGMDSGKPQTVRNKNRTTYKHDGVQVDVTAVISDNASQASKEIEVEMDTSLLNQYFDGFNDKTDPQGMAKFEELIRLSLDDTRLINREISRA